MITVVIPARRQDKVLENKNILPFANSTLLHHKIAQLKVCDQAVKILVSTDCNEIAQIAKEVGATVALRPSHLSKLNADFSDLCEHISDIVDTEHVMWAPVTCPLITAKVFDTAIDDYFRATSDGFDSLISVNKIKRFLLDNNGPLNFRFYESKRDKASLPTLFEFINAISICSVENMKKWRYSWGKIPYKYELPINMQIDICDHFDYELAKAIYDVQHELYS